MRLPNPLAGRGLLLLSFLLAPFIVHGQNARQSATISGELKVSHEVCITFTGPLLYEDSIPNPFLDYRLNVTFTQGARSYSVPGFFAADGNAANTSASSGSKWKVYFSPPTIGIWNYTASFRTGTDVAVDDDPLEGSSTSFDGTSGSFSIAANDKAEPDLRAKGLLAYDGTRYLKWTTTKKPFLKTGTNSPENLLAYYEFDNTYDNGGAQNELEYIGHADGLHHFDSHFADWNTGDITWQTNKGKRIVGAINYLASEGVNAMYFLTMNVNGDGREVFPWTEYGNRYHFDVSKLEQWNLVFNQMQKEGIVMHVVLQETENDQMLDAAYLYTQRRLYLREMVARFSHHNGLIWNMGEENTNTSAQMESYLEYIRAIDPYDHPTSLHTYPYKQGKRYTPLLGNPHLDIVSLQMRQDSMHEETIEWIIKSELASKQWISFADEVTPASTGVTPDGVGNNHAQIREEVLWGNLMGGGAGVEWYFGYNLPHNDLDCEDFRSRDQWWDYSRIAREFLEQNIPYTQLTSLDGLHTTSNDVFVYADPGSLYLLYLEDALDPVDINLQTHGHIFDVRWFDPVAGGGLQIGTINQVSGPGTVSDIGAPPYNTSQEWLALLTRDNLLLVNDYITQPKCYGSNDAKIDVEVLNGTAPFTYLWSNGSTNQSLTNVASGTYTLTVTDVASNSGTHAFVISNPDSIEINYTLSNASCYVDDGVVDLDVKGGTGQYIYNWDNGASTAKLSGIAPGSCTVTISDYHDCVNNRTFTIIRDNTLGAFNTSQIVTGESCDIHDGAIGITMSGGVAPYSFLWSDGQTNEDRATLDAGSYTLTVTDANSCIDEFEIEIPFDSLSNGMFSNTDVDDVPCGGTQGSLTANMNNAVPPLQYSWTDGDATNSAFCGEYIEQGGLLVGEMETAALTGDWTVENSNAGFTGSGYIEWRTGDSDQNVYDPALDILKFKIRINTPGRYMFEIRNAAPHQTEHNDFWIRFPETSALAMKSGVVPTWMGYTWFKCYQNQANDSWTYETRTVDHHYHEVFVDFPSAGHYTFEIAGRSTQIKLDRFVFYQSTISQNVARDTDTPISTSGTCGTNTYNNLNTGLYNLLVTDSRGCTYASNYEITEAEDVLLSSSKSNITCNDQDNGTATVFPGAGKAPFDYVWSDASTTSNISKLGPGIYTCTVTDDNNCTENIDVDIFEPSELLTFIIQDQPNPGDINLLVSGAINPYTYSWSNGASTEDLSNPGPGFYFAQVVDKNGCAKIITTVISPTPQKRNTDHPDLIRKSKVELFPNPNQGDITLRCEGCSMRSFDIIDVTGKVLKTIAANTSSSATVELHSLPAGFYFCRILMADGSIETRRLIKE